MGTVNQASELQFMDKDINTYISFVIPCYNSSKSLKIVTDEILDVMIENSILNYEIILINDNSTDSTLELIKDLCYTNKNFIGIDLSNNFGQQQAMLAGFSHATGSLIAYCDDDGQSPVSEIFQLVTKIGEGFDMVWAKYDSGDDSLVKIIGGFVNNCMLKLLFKKPFKLHFGNLWVAKRFVVKQAATCSNPFPYLGGIFLKITLNMSNVTLCKRNRLFGSSNYSFLKLFSVWLNGFTAFSVLPLRLASLLGFIFSMTGFIAFLYIIYIKINNPNIPIGYTSIISLLLFTMGNVMLMLGIIGEYIGRIYINLNNVPQYVVKDIITRRDG
jgi:polyisoprenyl-phosphate glycosyltransferase